MIKGLLGGLKTLIFALVLLFFSFYVIAVLGTTTLNPSSVDDIDRERLFGSVLASMFTVYRCFMGECITEGGAPIVALLAKSKGWPFILCYLGFSVFVQFGLFNLIVAIYIESTLTAARINEEKEQAQRHRESLRIARHTKELLKKFYTAQRKSEELAVSADYSQVHDVLKGADFTDVEDVDMKITKEVFLLALQDPDVQHHMDELDLPPDRASLFDALDADGSGGLEVTELITGFLRVRGETRKSDIMGAVLGVRALQVLVRQLDRRMVLQTQLQEDFIAREMHSLIAELRRGLYMVAAGGQDGGLMDEGSSKGGGAPLGDRDSLLHL